MVKRTAREQQRYKLEFRAFGLLARREYSRTELASKLASRPMKKADDWEPPDSVILEELLDSLVERNLQSDERFAESFSRDRINRGRGPMKLRAEMRDRGISDQLQREALIELEVDWFKQAVDVRRRRFGLAKVEEFKEKARQMRFLQSRGFSQDHISHAMRVIEEDTF
jgi:regulatory protein